MAWSGGTYSRTDGSRTGGTVWAQAKAAAVKIIATDHDTHDQDLADGINATLHKGGQNSATANIAWGGFKITGLGAGSTAGDSVRYEQVGLLAVANTWTADQVFTDTGAGAGTGPTIDLYRNSASPAAADVMGEILFTGEDDGGGKETYSRVYATLTTAADAAESGTISVSTIQAGTLAARFHVGAGLYAEGNADPGAGKIDADDVLISGVSITQIPATTKMLFVQTNAPTGWTKDTDQNDKALRIVSGTPSTGGATAFATVFGSGKSSDSYTLLEADIPSHTHSDGVYNGAAAGSANGGAASGGADTSTTGATGGGGGHSHGLSLDLQYVDVIKATKD